MFLFLTFFLQSVKLWSPLQSGFAFLPFSAGVIIGAGVGSNLVLKVGAKIVVPAGLVLGAVGLLLLSRLTLESSYVGTILPGDPADLGWAWVSSSWRPPTWPFTA